MWKHVERCACAGFGAGIGLCIALSMGWPWWAWSPLCAIVSAVSYEPMELIRIARETFTQKNIRYMGEGLYVLTCLVTFVPACVISSAVVPIIALCAFAMALQLPELLEFKLTYWTVVIGSILATACTMAAWEVVKLLEKSHESYDFTFPLSRRLPEKFILRREYTGEKRSSIAWTPVVIVGVQLYAIAAAVFLVIDLVLTVAAAGATNARMSVTIGGFCGGVAATVAHFQSMGSGTMVLASIVAGGVVGLCWYPLGHFLGQPASHAMRAA